MKFFKCNKCGHVMLSVNEKSESITCCGVEARLLKAGEVDAALEKHVPAYNLDGDKLEFIAYEYAGGYEIVKLHPGDEPKAVFTYKGKGTLYEFCNKHGLWKKDVE